MLHRQRDEPPQHVLERAAERLGGGGLLEHREGRAREEQREAVLGRTPLPQHTEVELERVEQQHHRRLALLRPAPPLLRHRRALLAALLRLGRSGEGRVRQRLGRQLLRLAHEPRLEEGGEAEQLTPLGKLVVRAAHRVDRTLAHERRAFERLADHLLRALAGLGAERAKVAHS